MILGTHHIYFPLLISNVTCSVDITGYQSHSMSSIPICWKSMCRLTPTCLVKATMGGLWSSSPPIIQTLCHWINSITNLYGCDGIAPVTQGLYDGWRWASQTPVVALSKILDHEANWRRYPHGSVTASDGMTHQLYSIWPDSTLHWTPGWDHYDIEWH